MKVMLAGKQIYNKALDLIYPRRCPVCDDAVDEPGRLICRDCRDVFMQVGDTFCMKCGCPVTDETKGLCDACTAASHEYDRGRVLFFYDEPLKESIYRFKYGGRREYADYYAQCLAAAFGRQIRDWAPDALVPIPIHPDRMRKRGYNQAGELAVRLGDLLKLPVREDVLVRTGKTRFQKELKADERQNNLKKALKISSDDVKLKNVVLVDDIYTTGSTMDAAASSLRGAGVENIYYVVVGAGVKGY